MQTKKKNSGTFGLPASPEAPRRSPRLAALGNIVYTHLVVKGEVYTPKNRRLKHEPPTTAEIRRVLFPPKNGY